MIRWMDRHFSLHNPSATSLDWKPLTEGVVGVDAGAGDVPAADGGVHAPTEALLPWGAHRQAQHWAHVRPEGVHWLHV